MLQCEHNEALAGAHESWIGCQTRRNNARQKIMVVSLGFPGVASLRQEAVLRESTPQCSIKSGAIRPDDLSATLPIQWLCASKHTMAGIACTLLSLH